MGLTFLRMKENQPFTKKDLETAKVSLLRDGRWGNACVSVAEIGGKRWTIKDFSTRHWLVRNTFARFVLRRELKAVRKLKGMKSGVPQEAFMLDACTLAVEYVPGRVLSRVPKEEITPEFLCQCEDLIHELHGRDLVHLDTRGTGNWVMRPDGTPGLIDFQASVHTSGLPKKLRSFMEDMDIGGVYKKWAKFCPEAMDEKRQTEYDRINKLRKLWVVRGYFGIKKKHTKHIHGKDIVD